MSTSDLHSHWSLAHADVEVALSVIVRKIQTHCLVVIAILDIQLQATEIISVRLCAQVVPKLAPHRMCHSGTVSSLYFVFDEVAHE